MIRDEDLDAFLEEQLSKGSPVSARDIILDYFLEMRNGAYERLYVNPNPCRRKTSLDPYLPALKKALGLGDGLYEYALVYFSW
jgi:hypothetical protein